MNRSRNLVDSYYNRDISLHKPGVIPNSSRIISPITANRHKYELKQRIWPKKTVESWFANHSSDERRAVYNFLDTLYKADDTKEKVEPHRKSPSPRLARRINTATASRRLPSNARQDSRASKRDLGEVLETLESLRVKSIFKSSSSFRPSSSVQDKSVQTTSNATTGLLPIVNGPNSNRPSTSLVKQTQPENIDDKSSRRYLSQTWRVINPRDDIESNVRPDHNSSSFFNYTKKTYPEYFFIHPDWY